MSPRVDRELTPTKVTAPVFIIGMGEVGRIVADALRTFDIGYLAVERDTVRLQAAIADGYEVEYGDRVVECRARSRPHVAGTSFQQPSCPRLIRAVDQRIALQVARLGDGSTMLQPRGRAHRDQVVSSILADDASDGSPPVVVVMAHRPPKPTSSGTLLLFTLPRATGRCRIGATMD